MIRSLLHGVAWATLAASCVWAQSGLGSISGTVVDPTGATIPGATVRVVQLSTNSERTTSTNETGLFAFPSLVASKYTLTITAAGFKEKKLENLELNAFQTMSLGRIECEVGSGPASVVTVTAEQQIVKENAVRYETIQSRQVTEMPLQGRNWATMLKVIPGSAPRNRDAINGREASFDGYGDFRINGKHQQQTQVNLDGGSIVDHGNDAKTTVQPSLEAIQEVAILTNNFQAEYGNRSGAVINIVTKSGTNELHGTVFNYMRNEALNANSWQRQWDGLRRARYRYNYFGANAGGPVRRDKLFFFYNFESPKQDTPTITRKVRVPTEAERRGDFSETINANGTRPILYLPGTKQSGNPQVLADNRIPAQLIHPLGKALMSIYPLPNYKDDTSNNFMYEYQRLNTRYVNTGKVDWNINEKTRAYFRYNEDYMDSQDRTTWVIDADLPFGVLRWQRPNRALAANVTRTWSPTLVSEQLFSWSYDYFNFELNDVLSPDKALRDKVGLAALPNFFKTNAEILPRVSGTGPYPGWHFDRFPMHALAHEYQVSSTWTWTRGAHIIKFGGQFIRNTKDEIDSGNDKGRFDFGRNSASNFDMDYEPANMLTGALNYYTQISNQPRKFSMYRDLHFFAQDTWKITPKLTLDFGVRFYHSPSEYNTRQDVTLDAAFFPSKWDPAKAPRYYVPDPKNPSRIIDPRFPDSPLPANMSEALRFSIVPGSGDIMNGVLPLKGGPGIRNPKWLLLAPRGGLAYALTSKTVLRAGFGWSYNRPTITQAINRFENALADQVDYRQTHIDVLTNSNVKRLSPRNFAAIDESSNAMPTVYDYSIEIQRELPANMVMSIAYVGNVQRHQNTDFNINQVLPGEAWKPQYIDPRLAGRNFAGPVSASNPGPLPGSNTVEANLMRPFAGFGSLTLITNNANAVYNSMQSTISKRFGHGLTFQAAHTYGYLRTQLENKGPFYYNWKDYTGFVADQDRRHVTAINYIYEVPKIAAKLGLANGVTRRILDGWSISQVLNFYSGRYFSPGLSIEEANTTTGVGLNSIFTGSPDVGPRIGINGDPMANGGALDRWYTLDGFYVPNIPQDGRGSLNYLRTPGTHSNDVTITKMIPVTEKRSVELRASIFNPFNMVRRDNVNTSVTYKAQGATFANGFKLYNTPQQQVDNLLARRPTANAREIYNQYRGGSGHLNVTDVHPMRIIEIGLRFRF